MGWARKGGRVEVEVEVKVEGGKADAEGGSLKSTCVPSPFGIGSRLCLMRVSALSLGLPPVPSVRRSLCIASTQ